MEEYNMVKIWRDKLAELELQRKLMSMDEKFSHKDLMDMDEMIKQVKKEYAKAVMEEEKDKNETRKSY